VEEIAQALKLGVDPLLLAGEDVRTVRNHLDSQSNHPDSHVAPWLFGWLNWLSEWFLTFLTEAFVYNMVCASCT
jgi:hypothetical protein